MNPDGYEGARSFDERWWWCGFGGGRRCATRLQQPQGCCALAIVTPALVVAVLAVPRTALNLQAIEEQARTR
jgi:hypothetical protein